MEINAFSIIMGLSLIGLIPLAIWANKRDYAQIKDIMQKWLNYIDSCVIIVAIRFLHYVIVAIKKANIMNWMIRRYWKNE